MEFLIDDILKLLRAEYIDLVTWSRLSVTSRTLRVRCGPPRLPSWVVYGCRDLTSMLGDYLGQFLRLMEAIGWPKIEPDSIQVHPVRKRVLIKWWSAEPVRSMSGVLRGCVFEFCPGQKRIDRWHPCDARGKCLCQFPGPHYWGTDLDVLIGRRIGVRGFKLRRYY